MSICLFVCLITKKYSILTVNCEKITTKFNLKVTQKKETVLLCFQPVIFSVQSQRVNHSTIEDVYVH